MNEGRWGWGFGKLAIKDKVISSLARHIYCTGLFYTYTCLFSRRNYRSQEICLQI